MALYGIMSSVNLTQVPEGEEIPRVLNYMPLAHVFGCGTVVATSHLGTTDIHNIFQQ